MNKILISTKKCCIPYIIGYPFKYPILIYIDDIYHHYLTFNTPLKKLLNTENQIHISFLNQNKPTRRLKTRTINTSHGNVIINEEQFNKIIELAKPTTFCKFDEQEKFFNPKINEIFDLENNEFVCTEFITELTEQGKMIFENKLVNLEDIDLCSCCGYRKEYVKYMFMKKEINAYMIIQMHNFNQFLKLFNK